MTIERGTVVAGRYTIEGILGRGAMSVVYSARDPALSRHVALKVLGDGLGSDPEFVVRFRREGRLQGALAHPHIVPVYDAGESEHGLYLALQLVRGSTLAALMQERSLDGASALAVLRQVAEGLDAAHAAGLVHRDVKPQNVLVGSDGHAYLGDFGLTRAGEAGGVTATGKLLGTISYLAPEVIRGAQATPAADRYAFAATLFECLTGTPVYPRKTDAAVLFAHTSEPPPRVSTRRAELPAALDLVFDRALAKGPDERPRTAVAVVNRVSDALRSAGLGELGAPAPRGAIALSGPTLTPVPTVPETEAPHPRRRLIGLLAAAALAGASIATAATLVVVDRGSDPAVAPPAPLPGTTVLGSDLSRPGHPLGCNGRQASAASPSCSIVQSRLPGRMLVVPRDGVVRRWAVRSARGELALAVLRPRGGGVFQVARSRNEFVDERVHAFTTDVAVEQGDLLGLVVAPGSAAGLRTGVDGAGTERWVPYMGGWPARAADRANPDEELLFRVEYVPGARQRQPELVTGADARALPAGRVLKRDRVRVRGTTVELALVARGAVVVLDQFVDGRRDARIEVPGLAPEGGRVITFGAGPTVKDAHEISVYLEYANAASTRLVSHYLVARPNELELVM